MKCLDRTLLIHYNADFFKLAQLTRHPLALVTKESLLDLAVVNELCPTTLFFYLTFRKVQFGYYLIIPAKAYL